MRLLEKGQDDTAENNMESLLDSSWRQLFLEALPLILFGPKTPEAIIPRTYFLLLSKNTEIRD